MGIIHSVSADYYKLDKPAFREFFSTSFVIPILVMLVAIIGLFVFREPLERVYGFPPLFIWIIPLLTFLIFFNEQLLSLARNNHEPLIYLKANVGKTILEFGGSLLLVVGLSMRWEGRVAGIGLAYGVLFFYGLHYFYTKGYIPGAIKKKYLISELKYAIPIIALQAAIFSMSASDKFFLSAFTSDNNESVGIYSIACVFASVINVLSMALLQYIFPKIYSILSKKDIDYPAIKKHAMYYMGVMFIGLLITIIITPLLYTFWINEKYHAALSYSYLLCIGSFLWAISYFFYSFLLYFKNKTSIFLLSVCCIVISLLANYYFIPQGGAKGAAIAVCISYSIVLILSLIFTRKYWKHFFIKATTA